MPIIANRLRIATRHDYLTALHYNGLHILSFILVYFIYTTKLLIILYTSSKILK